MVDDEGPGPELDPPDHEGLDDRLGDLDVPGDGLDLGAPDPYDPPPLVDDPTDDPLAGIDLDELLDQPEPEPDAARPDPARPESEPPRPDRPGAEPVEVPAGPPADAPPITLDLDDLPDRPVQQAPGEVDLHLDDDLGVPGDSSNDPGDAGEPAAPGEIDLTLLDAEVLDAVEPAQGDDSWLVEGLVAAGLATIGVAIPVALARRRLQPPELAAHLDHLGIDARVEHFDLTDLDELVAADGVVLVARDGSAGLDRRAVLELRGIDRRRGRIDLVDHDGARRSLPLDVFEAAWNDSACQVVVADGGGRRVALLPVVLDDAALDAAR